MIGRKSSSRTDVHLSENRRMSSKLTKRVSHKILNQVLPDLRESTFYQKDFKPVFLETIRLLRDRAVEQIVCYGLGTFHSGTEIASRYQLALLLLIYDELVNQRAPVSNVIEIFDPSFEPQDIEVFRTLPNVRFHIIEENEHCARKIVSSTEKYTTLVYMPHLDKHFYNNLLGANWYPDCIDRLLILGNSFSAMIDYETTSVCKTKLYYMNLLVNNFKRRNKRVARTNLDSSNTQEPKVLIELAVESEDVNYREIFNNFAFHFVNDAWVRTNKMKIEQNRLIGWDKVVSSNSDNESNE